MTAVAELPHVDHTEQRAGHESRPFSIEPVVRICSSERGLPPDGSASITAARLGVHPQQIYRWLRSGLTANQADVMAILLGHHPCVLWPDWFSHAPGEEEVAKADQRGHTRQAPLTPWCPEQPSADNGRLNRMTAAYGREMFPTTPLEYRVKRMRLNRMSAPAIAATLTAENVRTPAGNRVWTELIVNRLVRKMKGTR